MYGMLVMMGIYRAPVLVTQERERITFMAKTKYEFVPPNQHYFFLHPSFACVFKKNFHFIFYIEKLST